MSIDIKPPDSSNSTPPPPLPPRPLPPPRPPRPSAPSLSAISSLQAPSPDLNLYIVKEDYIADQPGKLSVQEGEKFLILSKSDTGNWTKGITSSEKLGWVRTSNITKDNSLENYSWFHANLTDTMAKDILSDNITSTKHFFVWNNESRPNAYTVEVYDKGRTFEFLIHYDHENSFYYLNSRTGFKSVPQLVAHYSSDPDGLQSTLCNPILSTCKSTFDSGH